jgi:hypothetical protein
VHIRAKSFALTLIAGLSLSGSMGALAAVAGPAGSGAVEESGLSSDRAGGTSVWQCMSNTTGNTQGIVRIWWGHTEGDAEWACNHWISSCGNNGGCYALRIH